MAKTSRRKSSKLSPYLRNLQKLDNYVQRQTRYEADAARFGGYRSGTPRQDLLGKKGLPVTGYGLYTGHGGYKGTLGRMMRSKAAKGIGRTLLREGVKAGSAYLSGSGAYNSLIAGGGESQWSDQVPSFSSAGDETGALTITHREYVTDVFGPATSAFNLQSYALNPGLEQSFPWLSQIAANYEEYEFSQLLYTYRSTTTDIGNSSNGQCGTIIMATNYNASAQPFQDKITMMEYDAAMSSKVTEHMQHGVECDPEKRSGASGMYVRTQPLPPNQDIKTYDHGLFQFALANTPTSYSNFSLGEIWVSYTCTFRKPRFYTNRGLSQDKEIYVSSSTVPYAPSNTVSMLGAQSSWYNALNNNIGGLLTVGAGGQLVYTFPATWAGTVEFVLSYLPSNGTVCNGFPIISWTGQIAGMMDLYATSVASTPHGNNASGQSEVITSGGGGTFNQRYHVKVGTSVGGVNNAVVIGRPAFTGTGTLQFASLEIFEYNPSFSVSNNNSAISFVNSSGVSVTW